MEDELILYSVNAIRSMEVIDISTGCKLGYTKDYKIEINEQKITAILLAGATKGWFSKEDDIEIPWEKVIKIGVDVLLVDASGIELNLDENKI